jgi:REP element-mobilizing transposase RayT
MAYKYEKQYRYKGYDYAQDGWYFVTICTKDREMFFGNVVGTNDNAFMQLSEIGRITDKFWREIPRRFNNVELDKYIIMPNHIHGITHINNSCRNVPRRVPTKEYSNNGILNTLGRVPVGIQPLVINSLSSIVNHFKGNVKRHCNNNNIDFVWQTRFHDRIIRNLDELNRIRQYIMDNPIHWALDHNNPNNINKNFDLVK